MGDALRAALRPYGLSQLHCLRQSPLPLSQEEIPNEQGT
jgi:hypothetical protein